MATTETTGQSTEGAKPAGGYRLVGVGVLFAAWWAYRSELLKLIDLRTYFAALEMVSRRCVVRAGTQPRFTITELRGLLGTGTDGEVRRSLARLSTLGLVRFQPESIRFAGDVSELALDQEAFSQRFQLITNRKRRVPVPRRTLRMLARCRGPVVIATVLGHLLRCVYAKGLSVSAEGSVSAAWVAKVFQVDPRNVKRARAKLRAQGWLEDKPSDHWHRQRHGARVGVNLQWSIAGSFPARKSPLRVPGGDRKSPPPDTNRKLLNGFNNQKPASGAGAKERSVPNLQTVRSEDLTDVSRLLNLFTQAEKAGWVGRGEHDRLQFVGAAVRARRCATRNPCGFFLTLVRKRMWHHLQCVDEDEARRKLNAYLHGDRRTVEPSAPCVPIVSTRDIQFVAQLSRLAKERGCPGDPFELIQGQVDWDRDRWDRALRSWLGVPQFAENAAIRLKRPRREECLAFAPPTESPLPPRSGQNFLAGRSGVKVEPSEKRLRVLTE